MGQGALEAARQLAAGMDPLAAAMRCGIGFDGDANGGTFAVPLLGVPVSISYPALEYAPDAPLPPHIRALLVHHLAVSDGSLPTGDWRAFADLPDGRVYSAAFNGYTGGALVRLIGEHADLLPDAVAACAGRPCEPGELATNADLAWVVSALPRVPIALVWWHADDEFPARAELLFDETAIRHLPIDGCAVLGSWLTQRVIANAGVTGG
ncbi:MAG: DUF3786 domain-containing protein [Coriobacteriia bacterium]|nr:DUF3786 domain-containing protein [Coriobacteriia bacterium]